MGKLPDEQRVPAASAGREPNGDLLAGRYELVSLLHEFHGVRTYRGKDTVSGLDIVVKVVFASEFPSGAHLRLTYEAECLSRLQSEVIALPLWFGSESGQVYLVSPYVPGVTLQERLKDGKLSVVETLRVATSLMTGLRELHEESLIHGDIKPSNVIVDGTPVARATLIDFGLTRGLRSETELDGRWAGTACYISPEQAGLLKLPIDGRADLYSAGILLYECLTGTRLFEGKTIGDVLQQQLAFLPESLVRPGLEVPRVLDELIQRLLQKDPRDRYQTAEGVQADLKDIATALEKGNREPTTVLGTHDRRANLTEPAFIGRRSELEFLRKAFDDCRQGNGGMILLEAESGGGKTRLLEEVARLTRASGGLVLRGQGLDQTAQRPFQLLVGVAQNLAAQANDDADLGTHLRQKLDSQREAVSTALPELGPVLRTEIATSLNPEALGPEAFGQIRNLRALSELLDALGSEKRPALVLLDDCQWADELTLKLLSQWHRKRERRSGNGHVLVIAAFRSEEVDEGHPLRRLHTSRRVKLAPFGIAEVRELTLSMAGLLPEEAMQMVAQVSEGSPFMATAVLRGLVESGALVTEAGAWRLNPSGLENLRSSRKAASFLVRRLELLDDEVLQWLTCGAILGKTFEAAATASLIVLDPSRLARIVDEAKKRHILWQAGEGQYAFAHDKLREALLNRLSDDSRKKLHRSVAEKLEITHPDRVFDLAYHFDAGGDSLRALPFALAAAEEARNRHSLSIALQQYRIAERGVSTTDEKTRKRIAEGLGDILLLQGEYDFAEAELRRALGLCENSLDRAAVEGKLGELSFKRGNVQTAGEALERGLRLLGRNVPATRVGLILALTWQTLVQVAHTLLPRFFLGTRQPQAKDPRDVQVVRLLSRMAYVFWFGRGKFPCLWAHLTEMNLAEHFGQCAELAQAYSEHAPVMTMVPWFKRGIAYAEKGFEIRRSLGDAWGQGQSLHFFGVALYGASRYEECIEKCREAVRLMEKTGDRWEVNTANWHIAFCHYRRGELRAAVELARQVYRAGVEIDDHQASGIALSVWARASKGRVPKEIIEAERRRDTGDFHTRVEILQAEGVRLLGEEKPDEATGIFLKAVTVVRETGLQQEYVAPVFAWLATSIRRQVENALREATPLRSNRLVHEWKLAVQEALKVSRKYRNNLPHALREAGIYWAAHGKLNQARQNLTESLSLAKKQGAELERYLTLEVRARIGTEAAWDSAESDQKTAAELMRNPDIAEVWLGQARSESGTKHATLSLADRFDTVLSTGKQIARSLTETTIREAVLDASRRLLRAETCLVLAWDETARKATCVAGAHQHVFSLKMVERAMSGHEALIFVEDSSHNPMESLLTAGIRSALCAPIFLRGKPAGCLYLSHRRVGALFGEEEKRLAELITAIAGAALENAEGFAKLQALNAGMEKEIEERKRAQEISHARAEELLRSNTDLARFAYVASHDLKEPLRMVSLYVSLLSRRYTDLLDKDGKEYMNFAVEGAVRMRDLIEALLAYSQVGTSAAKTELTDLNQAFERATGNLKVTIAETRARIECGPLPAVVADPIQMIQLFQNLIANGLKFRSDSPPLISIACHNRGHEWELVFRDNGIGIAPEFADKIFAIFRRLHTREQYPGTGIGLAICKRIAELHGGRIWVESQLGQGATFHVTLRIPTEGH